MLLSSRPLHPSFALSLQPLRSISLPSFLSPSGREGNEISSTGGERDTAANTRAEDRGGDDARAAASQLIRQWEAVFSTASGAPHPAPSAGAGGRQPEQQGEEQGESDGTSRRGAEEELGRVIKNIDGKVARSEMAGWGECGVGSRVGARLAWKPTVRLLQVTSSVNLSMKQDKRMATNFHSIICRG